MHGRERGCCHPHNHALVCFPQILTSSAKAVHPESGEEALKFKAIRILVEAEPLSFLFSSYSGTPDLDRADGERRSLFDGLDVLDLHLGRPPDWLRLLLSLNCLVRFRHLQKMLSLW